MKATIFLFFIVFYSTVNAWTAIERTSRDIRHSGYCYSESEGPLDLHETKDLKETCGTIFCTGNRDMIYTGCTKQVTNCGKKLPKREQNYIRQELDEQVKRPYPECCVVECVEDSDYTLTTF